MPWRPRSVSGTCSTSWATWQGTRAAYQVVIDSGHPDYAPVAAQSLGHLLRQQGDVAGARAAYQQAIDFGNPNVTPSAEVSLGNLLREGDVAGARAAYQRAIDSGHPEYAPMAAFGLGSLLQEQGDVAGPRPPTSGPSTSATKT